jgi:hypothetical protein
MGTLRLAVKARSPGFNVNMLYALIMTVPVEQRLEFMTIIGPYSVDSKWEFGNNIIKGKKKKGVGVLY